MSHACRALKYLDSVCRCQVRLHTFEVQRFLIGRCELADAEPRPNLLTINMNGNRCKTRHVRRHRASSSFAVFLGSDIFVFLASEAPVAVCAIQIL